MKAIIIGATGMTGSLLVSKLEKLKEFKSITALVRREMKSDTGTIYKNINFEDLTALKIKADAAFSCLGTTIKSAGSRENFRKADFTYNLDFARMCRKNGIERFILLSAIGADPDSKIFYNRTKGELEKEIKAIGFKYLTIIRPSLLEGPRKEWRTGEFIARKIMKIFNPLLMGNFKKYRSVSIDDITDIMIKESFREEPGIKIIENNEIVERGSRP